MKQKEIWRGDAKHRPSGIKTRRSSHFRPPLGRFISCAVCERKGGRPKSTHQNIFLLAEFSVLDLSSEKILLAYLRRVVRIDADACHEFFAQSITAQFIFLARLRSSVGTFWNLREGQSVKHSKMKLDRFRRQGSRIQQHKGSHPEV